MLAELLQGVDTGGFVLVQGKYSQVLHVLGRVWVMFRGKLGK